MPSVFRREKNPQPLSITLPQASQSYRCLEAFETKDTKNKPFTVAQKEIVEVLIKDMTGKFEKIQCQGWMGRWIHSSANAEVVSGLQVFALVCLSGGTVNAPAVSCIPCPGIIVMS